MPFDLMKRDPEYTGIGGYLNASNRNSATDKALVCAADLLALSYQDLFLWVNSRCARHFMDRLEIATPETLQELVFELKRTIPILKKETAK
jgi:hypothetical protein